MEKKRIKKVRCESCGHYFYADGVYFCQDCEEKWQFDQGFKTH